jgi:hypothetical protein
MIYFVKLAFPSQPVVMNKVFLRECSQKLRFLGLQLDFGENFRLFPSILRVFCDVYRTGIHDRIPEWRLVCQVVLNEEPIYL